MSQSENGSSLCLYVGMRLVCVFSENGSCLCETRASLREGSVCLK